MRRCLLVAVAAVAVGCGSSSAGAGARAAGQDAGVGTVPGDAGTGGGTSDAGAAGGPDAGGSGGAVDAGSGGSSDAGSSGGGGSPGDGGSADAGTADAGAADAGTAGGGVLSGDCANVVPPEGDPRFVVNLDVGEGFCSMSRPDDLQSTVPLSRSTRFSPREFFFFDSTTGMNLGHLQTGENGPFGLLAQPHAYTGISVTGIFPNFATTVFGYSHTGEQTTVTRAGRNPIWSVDPAGGTVGIDLDTAPGDSTVTYFRFDKDNLLERRVSLQGPVARIAFPIVSLHEGDTLVVFNRELPPCSATWLDREGNQLTAPFALPSCQIGSGFPLLDGGLVLGELDRNAENHLRYQIADRATAVTAAPDWLLDRSPRQFFLLPGGKGYAFRAQSTDRTIELRAPAGNLCGRWDRPELGTGPLEIGRDGTLVVQDFRGAGCSFSWWPQLFR